MIIIFSMVIFAFGAVLGSFSTAIIYRIENNKSWIFNNKKAARSMCPKCKHKLGGIDLIPIFSWLRLKGKCCYCAEKLSRQYLIIEIISAVMALIFYLVLEWDSLLFLMLFLWPFMLSQAVLFIYYRKVSAQLLLISSGILLIYALFYT